MGVAPGRLEPRVPEQFGDDHESVPPLPQRDGERVRRTWAVISSSWPELLAIPVMMSRAALTAPYLDA